MIAARTRRPRPFLTAVLILLVGAYGAEAGTNAGGRITVAVAPPAMLDIDDGTAGELSPDQHDELSSHLYAALFEELAAAGVRTNAVADAPVKSSRLIELASAAGYEFALSSYVVRDRGRLGMGLNVYETGDGFNVAGRNAAGSSTLALIRALSREIPSLIDELEEYRAMKTLAETAAVRSIEFRCELSDVTITRADGRRLGVINTQPLELHDTPYSIGQTISVTATRPGYHDRVVEHRLRKHTEVVEIPRLIPRTGFATAIRLFPAYYEGAGAALRWYPIADHVFAELSGGVFSVSSGTSLAREIEHERSDGASDHSPSMQLTDMGVAVGTHLFVEPGGLFRPGLQCGGGAMRVRSSDWDITLPYIAPLNAFVSIGRQRVRARVVSAFRYTLGADTLDRRWLIDDRHTPYVWLEVAYTW